MMHFGNDDMEIGEYGCMQIILTNQSFNQSGLSYHFHFSFILFVSLSSGFVAAFLNVLMSLAGLFVCVQVLFSNESPTCMDQRTNCIRIPEKRIR